MSSLRQLKVTFDSFDDLVESIGPGLSRTHILVRTGEVIADGTRVRLDIGTVRKGGLIRGVAKVAGPAGEGPGLHLHLIHLDPPSTRLVDSIVRGEVTAVDAREASGPSPFDIPSTEPALPEPDVLSQDLLSQDVESQDADPESRDRPAPRRSAWPLALIALAGVSLLVFRLATGGGDDHQELTGRDRQTEVVESAPSPSLAVSPPEETAAESSVSAKAPAEDPMPDATEPPSRSESPPAAAKQVEDLVHAWADAWSRQDPAAYIDLYTAAFSPAGLDRDTWERQRRERIKAPGRLAVSVSDFEVEIVGPERAIASFQQLYVTEEKTLVARKVLELERFDAAWKIVAERVER